jgi:predicted aconitase
MNLTPEEQDVLDGRQGPVLQKAMKTLVAYGRAMEADRFLDIEGPGHFAIPCAIPGVGPPVEMLEEWVDAGLTTKYPFTLDPRAPLDFENLQISEDQKNVFIDMYRDQDRYDRCMRLLGLRDEWAYTCTPYLPEVGNIPEKGTILAWSESSCVVYVNSVVRARTNRNAAILDLLSNIVGKTPRFGLLTDEGRMATWRVDVETSRLPPPQLLGAAIGGRVQDGVPFIAGLGRFLSEESTDYLKEMGAACAAIGAVGLYHIDGVTPEAKEYGPDLLVPDHETLVIRDADLKDLFASYRTAWSDGESRPEKCLIGCPHLSVRELEWWADNIHQRLVKRGRKRVAIETILFAAPQIIQEFESNRKAYARLEESGVKLSPGCPEAYMENPLCARQAVVTNSNKLRTFTPSRLVFDETLLEWITGDS